MQLVERVGCIQVKVRGKNCLTIIAASQKSFCPMRESYFVEFKKVGLATELTRRAFTYASDKSSMRGTLTRGRVE